jgi:hypothetical protein
LRDHEGKIQEGRDREGVAEGCGRVVMAVMRMAVPMPIMVVIMPAMIMVVIVTMIVIVIIVVMIVCHPSRLCCWTGGQARNRG